MTGASTPPGYRAGGDCPVCGKGTLYPGRFCREHQNHPPAADSPESPDPGDDTLREIQNRLLPALYARTRLDNATIGAVLGAILQPVAAYGRQQAEQALRDAIEDVERRLPAIHDPDPLSDWSAGVVWMLERLQARADEIHESPR